MSLQLSLRIYVKQNLGSQRNNKLTFSVKNTTLPHFWTKPSPQLFLLYVPERIHAKRKRSEHCIVITKLRDSILLILKFSNCFSRSVAHNCHDLNLKTSHWFEMQKSTHLRTVWNLFRSSLICYIFFKSLQGTFQQVLRLNSSS